MTKAQAAKAAEPSLARITFALARHYLGGWRGLIVLSVALLVLALVLGWSWLVAIGLAPLLLALAPCAAMCVIGICASRWRKWTIGMIGAAQRRGNGYRSYSDDDMRRISSSGRVSASRLNSMRLALTDLGMSSCADRGPGVVASGGGPTAGFIECAEELPPVEML